MKYLLIISTFCLFSCFGKDFEVIEASSQKWYGGTPGSGKGYNYMIKAVSYKSSDYLNINKIWIGDDYYEITPLTNLKDKSSSTFAQKDTVYIKIHKYIRTNMLGNEVNKEINEDEKVPQLYEGAALIGYNYKGKQKYKVINSFTKLKLIAYP